MPDRDDLSDALRDYYQRLAHEPAPDVTGRVMMAADTRSRRMHRFATLGGGAFAAAAAAAVVVVALATHGPSHPATGPAHSSTPSPAPTGAPTPTITPVPAGPPGGPVPPGFTAVSVTFVSADEGWVLGNAPCASPPCTSIVRTRDGGATWQGVPAPRISLATESGPVSIRFADQSDGWVVSGGRVEATHDGGSTWHSVSLPGLQPSGLVYDLEASAGIVDAWVVDSASPAGAGPARLYHAAAWSDSWDAVANVAVNSEVSGQLSLVGSHGWLVVGTEQLYATSDGTTWQARPSPCPAQYSAGVATANAGTVYASCTGQGSAGGAMVTRTMLVSHDGGQTFRPTGPPLQSGDFSGITATPDGMTVALAVYTGGPASIQLSSDGGAHFSTPFAQNTAGAGFADLGFTNDEQGVAVLAPTSSGSLLMTHDGGRSWAAVRF